MDEQERMYKGEYYNPYKADQPWASIRAACKRFNESEFWSDPLPLQELCTHFAKAGDDITLTPPFYCDHGNNIYFGNHFYANTGLTILDENTVTFGNNVFLGPHVSIYTAAHPLSAPVRNMGLEYAKAVTIGSNVWIGGSVVINPGVTIGNDVVIGSGSVVCKDLPDHVIAAGNPCRILRKLTEEDHQYCQEQLQHYLDDPDCHYEP